MCITMYHSESKKPYFSFLHAPRFMCVCQNNLAFAVNLYQIVCFRHRKRKSFHFIAIIWQSVCVCVDSLLHFVNAFFRMLFRSRYRERKWACNCNHDKYTRNLMLGQRKNDCSKRPREVKWKRTERKWENHRYFSNETFVSPTSSAFFPT